MKKLVGSLALILATISTQAQTEKGAYAQFNFGYNQGINGKDTGAAYIYSLYNFTEVNATTKKTELANVGLGKGIHIGADFGYMFNKNVGAELGISYLLGGKISTSQTYLSGNYGNQETSSKMLQIKPTLVLAAGFEKINPYAKIGVVIGSGKITTEGTGKIGGNITNYTYEYSKGTPIGFQGSVGALYKLNSKIGLFGELTFINLSYAPKKGSLTKYTKNGVDQLPGLDVDDKEIVFEDSISTGPNDPNAPQKLLKEPFSFDSIGLNVGMRYSF